MFIIILEYSAFSIHSIIQYEITRSTLQEEPVLRCSRILRS